MTSSAADTLKELAITVQEYPDNNSAVLYNSRHEIDQALQQLHDGVIELIGEDEPVMKVEGLAVFKIKLIRNQLRKDLRTKVDEYFGGQE